MRDGSSGRSSSARTGFPPVETRRKTKPRVRAAVHLWLREHAPFTADAALVLSTKARARVLPRGNAPVAGREPPDRPHLVLRDRALEPDGVELWHPVLGLATARRRDTGRPADVEADDSKMLGAVLDRTGALRLAQGLRALRRRAGRGRRPVFPASCGAARSVPILLYHRVNDCGDPFFDTIRSGRSTGRWTSCAATRPCFPSRAARSQGAGRHPRAPVAVTFDDGYRTTTRTRSRS